MLLEVEEQGADGDGGGGEIAAQGQSVNRNAAGERGKGGEELGAEVGQVPDAAGGELEECLSGGGGADGGLGRGGDGGKQQGAEGESGKGGDGGELVEEEDELLGVGVAVGVCSGGEGGEAGETLDGELGAGVEAVDGGCGGILDEADVVAEVEEAAGGGGHGSGGFAGAALADDESAAGRDADGCGMDEVAAAGLLPLGEDEAEGVGTLSVFDGIGRGADPPGGAGFPVDGGEDAALVLEVDDEAALVEDPVFLATGGDADVAEEGGDFGSGGVVVDEDGEAGGWVGVGGKVGEGGEDAVLDGGRGEAEGEGVAGDGDAGLDRSGSGGDGVAQELTQLHPEFGGWLGVRRVGSLRHYPLIPWANQSWGRPREWGRAA